jgi:hypothetical protein
VAPLAEGDDGAGATGCGVGDVAVGCCSWTAGCSGFGVADSVGVEADGDAVFDVSFAHPASATSKGTTAMAAKLDRRVMT